MRSIGSICTATLRPIGFPHFPFAYQIFNGGRNNTSLMGNVIVHMIAKYSTLEQFMLRLARLTIVSKLYAIFTLLAGATVALAGIAVVNARHHAAMLHEYEASLVGTQNVERVNG